MQKETERAAGCSVWLQPEPRRDPCGPVHPWEGSKSLGSSTEQSHHLSLTLVGSGLYIQGSDPGETSLITTNSGYKYDTLHFVFI